MASTHPKLFDPPRVEKGVDWEIAFYRSMARADGIIRELEKSQLAVVQDSGQDVRGCQGRV